MTAIAPGWYPDPAAPESGNMRWWSGEAWTQHVQAPQMLPPVPPMPQIQAQPAYVPFSSANTYSWAPEQPPVKRRSISGRFIAIAAVLVVALGAGALFGIPALFGQPSPLASAFATKPIPTATPIPVAADLAPTATPAGTDNAAEPANLHPTIQSIVTVEAFDVANQKDSEPACDPLWYTAPVTPADSKSTDPIQIMQPYTGTGIVMTTVARQFSTVADAEAQQASLLKLVNQCQSGYTEVGGNVTMEGESAGFAPAVSIAWINKVTSPSGQSVIVDTIEERLANRSVRITCIEAANTGNAATACLQHRADVSAQLAHAENVPAN